MSLQVEKLEGNMAKLTIEASAEDFEKALCYNFTMTVSMGTTRLIQLWFILYNNDCCHRNTQRILKEEMRQ